MKAIRLAAILSLGGVVLTVFPGCETQRSACEREKRLTERMDELQMDLDGKIGSINSEVISIRTNPPVVVQQMPAPMPVIDASPTIHIEDASYPSKREQLEDLAARNREQVLWSQPPPPAPPRSSVSGGGAIRVPVPATTVQTALREAGFYNGAIDGKVGRNTVAAITAFQRSQGLKADGIVGRATWQRLQAYVPAGAATLRLK